jgi:hypothetical protein
MSTTPPVGRNSGPSSGSGRDAEPDSTQGANQGSNQAWNQDATQAPHGAPGSVGARVDEVLGRIETEVRHAIAYVNDAVIPQVRRESITAMRNLSDTLRGLADRLERSQTPPRGPQS